MVLTMRRPRVPARLSGRIRSPRARRSTPSSAGALADAIDALNPVGYWKLDESAGTVATDSSGNGRHGTYTGTHTLGGATGLDGRSYASFASGYVEIPDADVFSVGTAPGLTIFALVRATDVDTIGREFIVTKGAAAAYEWELTLNSGAAGRLNWQIYTPDGSNRSLYYVAGIPETNWTAIAVRVPSTAQGADLDIYVDGSTELTSTGPGTTSAIAPANGTAPVRIAQRGDTVAGQHFDGAIAHVAIFAGEVDVSSLFTAALADGWTQTTPPGFRSTLYAWYDPSDAEVVTASGGNVSQLNDKSGNNNHLVCATGADQPAINTSTLNGLPVLGFDGTEYLRSATAAPWTFIHNGSDAAIFVVARPGVVSDPNAGYGLLGTGGTASAGVGFSLFFDDRASSSRNNAWSLGVYRGVGASLSAGFLAPDGSATPDTYHIFETRIDANDGTVANRSDGRVDGGTLVTNDPTYSGVVSAASPTYVLEVGGAGNGVFLMVGGIAEVLIYSGALSDADMTAVRTYLETKWAL